MKDENQFDGDLHFRRWSECTTLQKLKLIVSIFVLIAVIVKCF